VAFINKGVSSASHNIYIGTRIPVDYKITVKICEILEKYVAMVTTSKKEEAYACVNGRQILSSLWLMECCGEGGGGES
jgi:hypothetical protein